MWFIELTALYVEKRLRKRGNKYLRTFQTLCLSGVCIISDFMFNFNSGTLYLTSLALLILVLIVQTNIKFEMSFHSIITKR